jgi:hypothetical protein
MVEVKLACKDTSKIPGKRLFEMQNNMYLVTFKVEKKSELLADGGVVDGDDNDPGDQNENDNGMEELDRDMDLEKRAPSRGGKSAGADFGQGCRTCSTLAGGRKVMDWVSLFQNREETMAMENSELTQYSYSRLLREMEAAMSDSDEEGIDMLQDDNELVRLLE